MPDNRVMKLAARCLGLVLMTPACGSSAPALRPIDQGAEVDRFLALQENYATLVERAKTPADAARSLDAYCSEHRATIDEVNSEVRRLTESDDSPHRAKIVDSTDRLVTRMAKVSARAGWADSEDAVTHAMDKCLYGSSAPSEAPTVPDDGSPLGVAECDHYLDRLAACLGAMPKEAQEAAMPAIAQIRASWRPLAKSAPEQLRQGCRETFDGLREAMRPACPDVDWN